MWIIIAVAVLVAGTALVVVLTNGGSDGTKRDNVQGAVPITMSDGVKIGAQVSKPSGSGRHPLVVMPASWGVTSTEYKFIAKTFTAKGFVVVAYTQRGFNNSGGKVDLAGPKTQRDASDVIDWALQHTAADPKRIGMLGISYGAGISLLAAAHDKRVRATVSMSTWADLADSFHANRTTSMLSLGGLLNSPRAANNLSPEVDTLKQRLAAHPAAGGRDVDTLSVTRSPADVVAAINRNKPAVMIANGWNDSIFAPQQLVPFFEKLTVPKRLQIAPGDHGGPEFSALHSEGNATVATALAWLSHYLVGAKNGIDKAQPIQLQDSTTRAWHGYSSWPASSSTVSLAAPKQTGVTIQASPATWTARLTTGTDSSASAGPSVFGISEKYRAPMASVIGMPAARAFVWSGPQAAAPTLVSGTPRLHVSVAASAPSVSFYGYLYDMAANGTGQLMSVTPYTVDGLASGTAKPVSVDLQPVSWTVPAGHHVTLVIDTVDPRWHAAEKAGTTLTLSSTTGDPASVAFPIG